MSWNYIVAKFSILHVFWRKDLFSSQNMLKFKKYEKLVLNFSIEKKNFEENEQKCFRLGSNQGPYACKAYVITTTLRELNMCLQIISV